MRKTRKFLLGLLALLLLLTLAVGGTFAYMFHRTEEAKNQLTPAEVACQVADVFDDGINKNAITVKNTGTDSAYVRVRLVTYWVNEENEIVAKPSATLTVNIDDNHWLADTSNNTYYYKYKLSAKTGENTTPNLLDEPLVLNETDDGYKQVIEVFAEAIQAYGTTDEENIPAVINAWGVTLDSAGNITSVP